MVFVRSAAVSDRKYLARIELARRLQVLSGGEDLRGKTCCALHVPPAGREIQRGTAAHLDLLQAALGLSEPWFVEDYDWNSTENRLDIGLGFQRDGIPIFFSTESSGTLARHARLVRRAAFFWRMFPGRVPNRASRC